MAHDDSRLNAGQHEHAEERKRQAAAAAEEAKKP